MSCVAAQLHTEQVVCIAREVTMVCIELWLENGQVVCLERWLSGQVVCIERWLEHAYDQVVCSFQSLTFEHFQYLPKISDKSVYLRDSDI